MDHTPESGRSPLYRWLRALLKPETVPGWLGILLMAFLVLIIYWPGIANLYLPAAQAVGGVAMVISDILQFQYLPLIVLVASCLYLGFVVTAEEGTSRAIWLPVVGWFSAIVLCAFMAAWLLFMSFIATSRVPELIGYVSQQTHERHIDAEQYEKAYAKLRNSVKDIGTVDVWGGT